MNTMKYIIFTFSGNSIGLNILVAEKEAMLFLYSQFKSSPFKDCSLQMYTNSMNSVEIALKNREKVFI